MKKTLIILLTALIMAGAFKGGCVFSNYIAEGRKIKYYYTDNGRLFVHFENGTYKVMDIKE